MHRGDGDAQISYGPRDVVFAFHGLPGAQTGVVHFEYFAGDGGVDVGLPVAAFAYLCVVVQVNGFVSIHNSYIISVAFRCALFACKITIFFVKQVVMQFFLRFFSRFYIIRMHALLTILIMVVVVLAGRLRRSTR